MAAAKKRVEFRRVAEARVSVPDSDEKSTANSSPQGREPPLKGGFFSSRKPENKEKNEGAVGSLLAAAARLTHAEKQELLDQLALQNQLTSRAAQNPDLDLWVVAVVEALDAAIGAQGGESYGRMLVKRTMGSSQAWRPVEQFMATSGLGRLKQSERVGCYFMLAELLVADASAACRHTGAPLSARLLAQRTGDLGGVFDRAFPGYLAAGLAPMVARQMAAVAR